MLAFVPLGTSALLDVFLLGEFSAAVKLTVVLSSIFVLSVPSSVRAVPVASVDSSRSSPKRWLGLIPCLARAHSSSAPVKSSFASWESLNLISISSSSSNPKAITSLLLGGKTVTVTAFASAFSWSIFFFFSSSACFSAAYCFFFSSLFFFSRATCFCNSSAAESCFFLLAVRERTVAIVAFAILDVVGVVDVGEEVGVNEFAGGKEEP